MFRGNLRRDGAISATGGNTLMLAWTYCTGAPIFSSPAVHAGTVYIASTNGVLAALDAHNGHLLWQYQVASQFYSSPSIEDGTVYIGALDGSVYAIDAASGKRRWSSPADNAGGGANIWSSPAVVDGLVIVGVASALNERPKVPGEVLAFDAATGERRWRAWTLPNGAPGGGIWSSPAIDEAAGAVYVGTGDPDDGVEALDLHDGHVLWHWRSVVRDVQDTDVGAGPLLYADHQGQPRLAVGGKDGLLYSLDARNGNVIWHAMVGEQVYSSPAYARGILYAVGAYQGHVGEVWALDSVQGASVWQHRIPVLVYASPALAAQVLYVDVGDSFANGDGGVQVYDVESGKLLQYVDLHSAVTSSPAIVSSWLFAGAHDGNVYAFTR